MNERLYTGNVLYFYRILIKIRKSHFALQQGRWVPLIAGQDGILAYARVYNEERIVVILNFTGRKKRIFLAEHNFGVVVFSTHRKQEEIFHFQNLWIFPFEVSVYNA